jgi:uncharacterized protein
MRRQHGAEQQEHPVQGMHSCAVFATRLTQFTKTRFVKTLAHLCLIAAPLGVRSGTMKHHTRSSERQVIAALLFVLWGQGAACAFDIKDAPPAPAERKTLFNSMGDALRAGIKGLSSGDSESAIAGLSFAAREGNVVAQWKLGRMYAEGEGVRHDELKAFQYFSEIANARADENPESPNARVISQAFVALGRYHLNGIPNSRVRKDPARAFEMFHYAATFFNDADAQFYLGRMMSEGLNGPKNLQQAARWFHLAAEKGHCHAQAHLGRMLFNGDGVPRQAPRGLMWMQLAANKADRERDIWVSDLHAQASASATEDELRLAESYLKKRDRGQLR